eukprot:gnl/Chilomastix_cuspidata/1439.p1 GENE.gnl/Chilomastix_cuspidata/1439~~gnl/Chilomastix_cuspidata/1439.p1  ORF type:complete len:308 (+),score=94.20 gnl/Chilomastix_cuspidata/1439:489-1412(+)
MSHDDKESTQTERFGYDMHTHCYLCHHASLLHPKAWIKAGYMRGLKGVAVCCHNPFPGDQFDTGHRMKHSDWPTFRDLIAETRHYAKKHLPGFDVLATLEIDYIPDLERSLAHFLRVECRDFDALLGSVHLDTPEEARYLDTLSEKEVLNLYFNLWQKAVSSGMFTAMTHMCFYRVTGRTFPRDYEMKCIKHALRVAARAGVALELNTTGCEFSESATFFLDHETLCEARELGIPIILSSDAHAPMQVGFGFYEALMALKRAGYTHVSHFKNFKRVDTPLGDALRSVIEGSVPDADFSEFSLTVSYK